MRMSAKRAPFPERTQSVRKATKLSVESDRWLTENREAIAAYNEHVEAHGVFSDGVRAF
jgi:post-segregation antitoxin (ccd killing protein)